jgi:hypothetical protein
MSSSSMSSSLLTNHALHSLKTRLNIRFCIALVWCFEQEPKIFPRYFVTFLFVKSLKYLKVLLNKL